MFFVGAKFPCKFVRHFAEFFISERLHFVLRFFVGIFWLVFPGFFAVVIPKAKGAHSHLAMVAFHLFVCFSVGFSGCLFQAFSQLGF